MRPFHSIVCSLQSINDSNRMHNIRQRQHLLGHKVHPSEVKQIINSEELDCKRLFLQTSICKWRRSKSMCTLNIFRLPSFKRYSDLKMQVQSSLVHYKHSDSVHLDGSFSYSYCTCDWFNNLRSWNFLFCPFNDVVEIMHNSVIHSFQKHKSNSHSNL